MSTDFKHGFVFNKYTQLVEQYIPHATINFSIQFFSSLIPILGFSKPKYSEKGTYKGERVAGLGGSKVMHVDCDLIEQVYESNVQA